MHREAEHQQKVDVRDIAAELRAVYDCENPKSSPCLFEQLLPKLPPFIRELVQRNIDSLVREEIGKFSADPLGEERRALAAFLDPIVLRAHLEVGRDAALSNERNTIAHVDSEAPIVAHAVIEAVVQQKPAILERIGCIFFDVDGTKTIVDCTSHAHAGKYLETMAEFLCHPAGAIAQWLANHRLQTEAYSIAGDEFIVMVRSTEQPVIKELLDAYAQEVQKAIAADARLTSFVSFDDPRFILEYDEWSTEDRAMYIRDPASLQEKFRRSREKLPERFTPSVSYGSATFLPALREALADTEGKGTLEQIGTNAFRIMVSRADERLTEDKRVFRKNIADQRWRDFLLRNNENRKLVRELDRIREMLNAVMEKEE